MTFKALLTNTAVIAGLLAGSVPAMAQGYEEWPSPAHGMHNRHRIDAASAPNAIEPAMAEAGVPRPVRGMHFGHQDRPASPAPGTFSFLN